MKNLRKKDLYKINMMKMRIIKILKVKYLKTTQYYLVNLRCQSYKKRECNNVNSDDFIFRIVFLGKILCQIIFFISYK
jgi:hypothetical protein